MAVIGYEAMLALLKGKVSLNPNPDPNPNPPLTLTLTLTTDSTLTRPGARRRRCCRTRGPT